MFDKWFGKEKITVDSEPAWRDPGPSQDVCSFTLVVDVWLGP